MAVLRIQNLKKSYRTPEGVRQTIIDVPSFAMEAGEQTALVGSSGSGKTTLLNLIAGILRPDAGSITLDGVNMSALSEAGRDRLRARTIGYVFQTFNLLQGYSALENVMLGMMFGGRADRDHAASLLERMGLGDRRSYKPSALSVGQQQRVAVARALANRPKLVIADEPTGNLDPQRAADALKLIRSVCEENGAALLLVSHDRHLIEQFDRVQALDEINRAAGAAEAAS